MAMITISGKSLLYFAKLKYGNIIQDMVVLTPLYGTDIRVKISMVPGGGIIAVYSFALKPEEHQPSEHATFTRIDQAKLITPSDGVFIYAVNYNVLKNYGAWV